MSALLSFIMFSTCIVYSCCVNSRHCWENQCFPSAVLWLAPRQDIKHRQTNTVENSNTVAVKEKLGGLGKKRTSSKHLWRTNTDAKDGHLCLQNHLLSLFVSVSLALTLIHCSFFTYAPFVPHKITSMAVKDTRALWYEHMFSSCSFLQVCRTQMRESKAKGNHGFKQNLYMVWYYRLRKIFIVNISVQAHRRFATVSCTIPGFVWIYSFSAIVCKNFPSGLWTCIFVKKKCMVCFDLGAACQNLHIHLEQRGKYLAVFSLEVSSITS